MKVRYNNREKSLSADLSLFFSSPLWESIIEVGKWTEIFILKTEFKP